MSSFGLQKGVSTESKKGLGQEKSFPGTSDTCVLADCHITPWPKSCCQTRRPWHPSSSAHDVFSRQDVFYDLGCGVGKLVLYVALRGAAQRSVGLEAKPERRVATLELRRDASWRCIGVMRSSFSLELVVS